MIGDECCCAGILTAGSLVVGLLPGGAPGGLEMLPTLPRSPISFVEGTTFSMAVSTLVMTGCGSETELPVLAVAATAF